MPQLSQRRTSTTAIASVVAVPVIAVLGILTLAPLRFEQRAPGFVHRLLTWVGDTFGREWATLGTADLVANTFAFVVIGILAYLIIPRRAWVAAVLVGPVVSIAIEVYQSLLLPERVASVSDIAAATIGSVIGVGIAASFTALTARRRD